MTEDCCSGSDASPVDAATDAADRDPDEHRAIVRERYADVADTAGEGCCAGSGTDSRALGYDETDLAATVDGADLGLGCGNPKAIADLQPGETVLDLGAGAGFDCFLAAKEVGEAGHVIGVDMTPEMVSRARENAAEAGRKPVEFRLGEIEHLPVADATADVVISNCVINLSPAKEQVFAEAYRVLRPGGRLAISDVVQTAELPAAVRASPDSLAGCVSGAATVDVLEEILAETGFEAIEIEPVDDSASFIREWDDERDLSEYVVSARIEAVKPATVPAPRASSET